MTTNPQRLLDWLCHLFDLGSFEAGVAYRMGRLKAQQFIAEINAAGSDDLGPIIYEPQPVPTDLDGLTQVRPQDLPTTLRQDPLAQIEDRTHRTLAEMGVNFVERQIIDEAFIEPQLAAFLGL